mmetsp:Transcript_107847/g.300692  ORF Transcript_107847/g.300692 Transcript_107847/m.300692 type:complete len:332 (-) Transcript_107847:162-1157(-)
MASEDEVVQVTDASAEAPQAADTAVAEEHASVAPPGSEVTEDIDCPHIVLLGDSTLDNGRYLNLAFGELSVEKQLSKRCTERGWEMTALAQDGSMLEDVLVRQLPLIPDRATHIVLSASGNDLLALLNQMVMAQFTARSMYEAIGNGLIQVAERYRDLIQTLKGLGCHLACCTVYRPNFNHIFFKSLAVLSLGMHNSRIQQISTDLDCCVIDLANMFDHQEDFANPLELSTRGGSKVVENVTAFVNEHPVFAMRRFRHVSATPLSEEDDFVPGMNVFGLSMRCCATRAQRRRVYASRAVPKALEQPDQDLAGGPLPRPLEFSEAQQRWREA